MIGRVIGGKWNRNKYIILSEVGKGSIGTVYKVKDQLGNIRALKLSRDIGSITREYYNMENIKKLDVFPNVYEIDDTSINGRTYNFFIMDYLEGHNLKNLQSKYKLNVKEILGIGSIILNKLIELNNSGYIYGDIKLENIFLDKNRKRISLIDGASIVKKGQFIKEYTPTYTMKAWGVGLNVKEDLNIIFGVSMIITNMLIGIELTPQINNIDELFSKIKGLSLDKEVKDFLTNGLRLKYKDIGIFKHHLKKLYKRVNIDLSIKKSQERIVNGVFAASIGFFLLTVIFCIKRFT